MNESETFFAESEENEVIDAEEVSDKRPGLCPECLGSGYRIKQRDGVMGVLFTSTSTDGEGKSIRRLVRCACEVDVSY
jgi:hypothetical protein